jgi:hypothetical protein
LSLKRLIALPGLLGLVTMLGIAADRAAADAAPPAPPAQGVSNETCLACHATPDMRTTLPSGEELFLTIERDVYDNSVHGQAGYACVQCHTGYIGFPHEPITAQTRREFTDQLYTSCARCHQDKYEATLDSVHQTALAGGNVEAAVCTDCHGAHNVQAITEQPRSAIPQTCERCHSEIYNLYRDSVHGSALIGAGNPDVPSCIDCHGVHNVEGPSTSPFRLFSPQICARCHADTALMDKYGISTNVFNSYITDFHGTTVTLFQQLAPDQETNKPVCIDCHGVHDIRRPEHPASTVNKKENLLATCRKCHPGADANFPTAWLSHYTPNPSQAPVVYFVDLFYKVFIPGVLGVMVVFVATDAGRRIVRRRRGQRHE